MGVDTVDVGEVEWSDLNRLGRRAAEAQFVARRKVFSLTFEDTDLAGLVVRVRSLPVGELLELVGLAGKVETGAVELDSDQLGAVSGLFDGFASALVSWNLSTPIYDADGEETGETDPVPPTTEGMLSQDLDLVMPIIMAWMEAASGVAAPLEQRSTNGEPSQVGSLPMEPKSPNPPS